MKLKQLAVITAVIASGWQASAQISYNQGDLLLGFRGAGGSSSNLVVDLGSASTYASASAPIIISQFTAAQVVGTFGSLNNLYFSVFGTINSDGPLGSRNTLWLTNPRSDASTQTSAANSLSVTGQGTVGSYLNAVGGGASSTTLGVVALSATAVIEPSSMNIAGNISYLNGIANQLNTSISGNIHGSWGRYPVEGLTGAVFDSDTTPIMLDLYQQNPGTGNAGQYLGNFQLNNDGSLIFNPVAVPEPSTWAMFGLGLFVLVAIRRFKSSH